MYITAKEVRHGILDNKDGFKDKYNVMTDISNDSEPNFNDSEDNEFNLILSADYNAVDDNMDID
jgi:hypothetical protein